MDTDIRAILAEAALGAPAPAPMTDGMRSAVRRRRRRIASFAGALIVVAGAGSFAAVDRLWRPVDVANRDCGGSWVVTTPTIPTTSTAPVGVTLRGGVIAGESGYWIVGDEYGAGKGIAVVVQGDGSDWTRRDIPHVAGNPDGVSIAGSGDNIWVGGYRSSYDQSSTKTTVEPVLMQWDGATWQTVAPPPVPPDATIGTLAVRGTRIVVAGTSTVARREGSSWIQVSETPFLADRIAGGPWRSFSLPDLRGDYSIRQIVIGPSGRLILQTRGRGGAGIVVQEGAGWRILTPPGKPIAHADIVSARDIWASRTFVVPADDHVELLHFDGRIWRTYRVPAKGTGVVNAIAGGPGGDAWIVASGSAGRGLRAPPEDALWHFDGKHVREERIEFPGHVRSIASIEIDATGRGIAVGFGTTGPTTTGNLVLLRC
ncbi:MAG TPA: hypothetical protein VGB64_05980 [Actinomycetota bacterium]